MGSYFSQDSKARRAGLDIGKASNCGTSGTKVAIVYRKDPKTGYFFKNDVWPLVFFDSRVYEGDLGYSGLIDTPWLHKLVASTVNRGPQGIFTVAFEPPTVLLQSYCRDQGYTVTFKTTKSKGGDFVLAEVSQSW
jgi:hypothetical protein